MTNLQGKIVSALACGSICCCTLRHKRCDVGGELVDHYNGNMFRPDRYVASCGAKPLSTFNGVLKESALMDMMDKFLFGDMQSFGEGATRQQIFDWAGALGRRFIRCAMCY